MKKILIISILIFSIFMFSCQKELKITEFEDDFGNYKPELKIEGLLQNDNPQNSIIRIIKTSSITDPSVYNGVDDDNDGIVDEYDEILPLIQDTSATIILTEVSTGNEYDFQYVEKAGSFDEWSDDFMEINEGTVYYGGYKPVDENLILNEFSEYRIEIDSKHFDKVINAKTKVFPSVTFIDSVYDFEDDLVTIPISDTMEIFWKSDLDVTAYYVTYEEMLSETESEFLYSFKTSRDNDLTKKYSNNSIGRVVFWGIYEETYVKITIEALNPDYGHYVFSSLPLNDPQRSNLRDENDKPVMGCFGATSAKSIIVHFTE